MKRVLILLILAIFLTSLVSAEMIISQQPNDLYNLGQIIRAPVKIVAAESIDEFFSLKLLCNGIENEVHKQYIYLLPGEEQEISVAIPLRTDFIGRSTGTCVIKAYLGELFILTNDFTISSLILIDAKIETASLAPEENLIIEGEALKENGENVNGFVSIELLLDGESKSKIIDTVKNGYLYLNTTLPKDTKAGEYLVRLDVFEKESKGNLSNKGFATFGLNVKQVPTSLEIAFEEKPVEPGTDLKIKAILHDQTGEKIESDAVVTIKNEKDKILEETEIKTDEFFDFPIVYNQPATQWTVLVESNKLQAEETFNISEKEAVEVVLVNRTVIITNVGNVPYNNTALVKIGNETINLDVYLEVDEETKYYLSAPEGEYEIEVRAGDEKLTQTVVLTGNVVAAEEVSTGIFEKVMGPVVWLFIIGVLGFMAYMLYKKGYKKTFFGYVSKVKSKLQSKKAGNTPITKDSASLISPKNPAVLSLSIKGEKQDVSLICLKIKNEKELVKNESVKEKLNDIVALAEETKAVTYENQNNIFFIWAPLKTRTFKNQKTAVELAERMQESLDKYNKLAKQKINFGMALNYGTIVAKSEKGVVKFMSMGTLITTAKRIASISDGEVFLSEKMNEKVMTQVKTDKHTKHKIPVWTIKEIRKKGKDEKKFISEFVRRLEDDNKKKKEEKK